MKHVVIDMGSSRISVMAAEVLDSGEVRVLGEEPKSPSEEVMKYGFVANTSGAAFTVTELVRKLQNRVRLGEVGTVCVSLNAKTMKQVPLRVTRSLGFGRVVTGALVDEMDEECYAKLNNSDVEVYDVIPRYYELDGVRTDDPVGKKGSELVGVYNLIVGNADIKTELERCSERTKGIGIVFDDFRPLGMEALSEVLLDDDEREAGCALINMGATTTTLAIYAEGVLQRLLVVPLGGKNITHDIKELGISEANAERLKCLKGVALRRLVKELIRISIPSTEAGALPVKIDTDFLAVIIEARLEEIMLPILKALQESPFDLNAGVVLTGGGAKLNGLVDFVKEHTGMEVRFGDHTLYLSPDTDERFADPVYAQQIGTVLLLHDYEKERAAEVAEEKKSDVTSAKGAKSGNTNSFIDKIKNKALRLFDDENYLK